MIIGRPSNRRAALAGLAALIVVAMVLAMLIHGARRSSASTTPTAARISTASIPVIHSRMVASLRQDKLSWHWVVCLRNGHRFRGVPIVRCNVDFGDPHIEAYCVVLRGGRLLTNFEDRAIPCGPDNAGDTQTIVAYS